MNSQNVSDLPLAAQPPKPVIRHYRQIVAVVIIVSAVLLYGAVGKAALDGMFTDYIICL